MTELQQVEHDILKEFIRVCDQMGLTYYVVCGTALGAVKYGGFIPWDDDIDVAMPREDYNIFIKNAQDFLPKELFVQNYITDVDFPQIFTKIRNSNTTYIEKSVEKLNINHGIYIDVFPLDGYPVKFWDKFFLEMRKKIYIHLLGTAFSEPKGILRIIEYRIKRCLGFHKLTAQIAHLYTKMIEKYSIAESDIFANHGNWQGWLEYSPKWQYGKGTIAKFEEIDVVIPEKVDEYLTQKYGKWQDDIPDEQKIGHHYYAVCDCKIPYIEYRKD